MGVSFVIEVAHVLPVVVVAVEIDRILGRQPTLMQVEHVALSRVALVLSIGKSVTLGVEVVLEGLAYFLWVWVVKSREGAHTGAILQV